MEAGQAQGASMDTRGFRWRVRPPCAPDRSPGPDATPAGTGRPLAGLGPPSAGLGLPSAGLGLPCGMGRAPTRIGPPELRKRARAPPVDGYRTVPATQSAKEPQGDIPSPETMLGQRVGPR